MLHKYFLETDVKKSKKDKKKQKNAQADLMKTQQLENHFELIANMVFMVHKHRRRIIIMRQMAQEAQDDGHTQSVFKFMNSVNKVSIELDAILTVMIEGKGIKDDIMNKILKGPLTLTNYWDANFYKAIIKKMQAKNGLKKMEEFMQKIDTTEI